MPIVFKNDTFHLYNNEVSYIFKILKNKQLGHLYYGKRLPLRESFDYMFVTNSKSNTACQFEGDSQFSLDYIKQEYPTFGTTDFSEGAYQIKQDNGSIITNFTYKAHNIFKGKPVLMNGLLPATYVEDESEATTLEVILEDTLIHAELHLRYTIYEDRNVITRDAKFVNHGEEDLRLTRALSMSVDFDDKDFEMLQLSGAWGRERHIRIRELVEGSQAISSARGTSSNQQNPFIALKRKSTDEFQGEVYAFSFVYSGNFLAEVEVSHFDRTRVFMGINPFNFEWSLKKGESFQTPEVVMVYSDLGLNGMSHTFHGLYRERLARGQWRDQSAPILINNWEATYFDFSEEKILELAKESKELGVELFVLDDGWFGKRNSNKSSLGDWFPNLEKLPEGIKGLSKKITDLGLKFGLWFEPEMISNDSELYKAHPDWVIHTPDRRMSHGRNQYVLDFSRKEVVDYLYNVISETLHESDIIYVKWDMNRNITEPYSTALPVDRQGELYHRYILGVYDLYDRLTKEFPHILFESCASGGARFDPAMLYYAPQAWLSDDTDSVERLKIQYGSSLVYPIKSMGSHVSAIPNHQVNRRTPLKMRGDVAYFGTFGYELDVTKLSDEEKNEVKRQNLFFKEIQTTVQFGDFYRITSPFNDAKEKVCWMSVSRNQEEAVVGVYQVLASPNPKYDRIRLKGLNPNYHYEVNGNSESIFTGDELMNFGLLFDNVKIKNDNITLNPKVGTADFSSDVYVLRRVDK